MPRFSLHTFGCKLNQIESEALADAFQRAGWELVPWNSGQSANINLLLINTCTVTSKAEQKARRLIREALAAYPHAMVIVTGCYAELDKAAIAALEGCSFTGRLWVLPGSRKAALLDLPAHLLAASHRTGTHDSGVSLLPALASFENRGEQNNSAPPSFLYATDAFRFTAAGFSFHSRPFLKIQDGCDRRCAYCRVPLARGAAQSLPAEQALLRLQRLEADGAGEVVLTGINLSLYGDGERDLAGLLSLLLSETSRVRLRISSIEPDAIADPHNHALLAALSHPRVQPHFHLPIQSGSASVLARMRRPYNPAMVEQAATLLRSIKEDPFLGCDMIAGFPGETERDAAASLELCRSMEFAAIHAFPFSPRPGTEAATFKDRVQSSETNRRLADLLALAHINRRSYITRWLGRELDAVLEKNHAARSANYLRLRLVGSLPAVPGACVRLRLIEVLDKTSRYDAIAECVDAQKIFSGA